MCNSCETLNPKQYAHRWEIPLARLGVVATVAAIAIGFGAMLALDSKTMEDSQWLLTGPMILILIPIMYVGRYYLAAKHRSSAALVGPNQFPEIWSIYSELLDMYRLPSAPSLYVQNGNGVVNAFAFSCSRARSYVVLHSEIALLAKSSPNTVRFVLAHELAHHKLGHVTIGRLAFSIILDFLYLPGKALSRAQEYSADRLALAYCPDTADSLMLLSVGPWLSAEASSNALLLQAFDEKNSLMIRVVNASQTHPVFTKRFAALKKIEQDGFDNHGPLF